MVHLSSVKNSAKCLEKDYQTLNIIYLSYKVSESYIFLFIHSFIQFKAQFCLSIQCKRMDLSFQEKKNNLKSDLWFQRYKEKKLREATYTVAVCKFWGRGHFFFVCLVPSVAQLSSASFYFLCFPAAAYVHFDA